jgi:hypothetical protein
MSREQRYFPDSIDMERAGAKIVWKKETLGGADCGCYMCTQLFWTPIACLCQIPPFNVCKACCIR